jgi:hypothetical protein
MTNLLKVESVTNNPVCGHQSLGANVQSRVGLGIEHERCLHDEDLHADPTFIFESCI